MFSKPVRPGLELRELGANDARVYFDLVDRNRAMLEEWEPGMAFTTVRGVEAFFGDGFKDANRLPMNLGIIYQGQLSGMVQLTGGGRAGEAVVGYWLSADLQGRGLVTECVRALVTAAFDELGYERVVIDCSEHNLRSRRVPERLGFTLEQVIPPERLRRGPNGPGQLIFAMQDRQWRGQAAAPFALDSNDPDPGRPV